jgi:PTH1 family peptidyl-tRNA hydrolase
MRLLHRRGDAPRTGEAADLLAVGLGNPGSEYERTRHNVGAEAVTAVAARHSVRLRGARGIPAVSGEARVGGKLLALAVPLTYLNESGLAVRALVRRYSVEDLGRLVIVHDELDLPPGVVKVKVGGGTAGHNGLRSIQSHLHSLQFARVRIGVGKPPGRGGGTDHVLRRPPKKERDLLDVAVEEAADAVEIILADGPQAAMNQVNGAVLP